MSVRHRHLLVMDLLVIVAISACILWHRSYKYYDAYLFGTRAHGRMVMVSSDNGLVTVTAIYQWPVSQPAIYRWSREFPRRVPLPPYADEGLGTKRWSVLGLLDWTSGNVLLYQTRGGVPMLDVASSEYAWSLSYVCAPFWAVSAPLWLFVLGAVAWPAIWIGRLVLGTVAVRGFAVSQRGETRGKERTVTKN